MAADLATCVESDAMNGDGGLPRLAARTTD
jgi:hypothetical protein